MVYVIYSNLRVCHNCSLLLPQFLFFPSPFLVEKLSINFLDQGNTHIGHTLECSDSRTCKMDQVILRHFVVATHSAFFCQLKGTLLSDYSKVHSYQH